MHESTGFTLLELLVVLVIFVIAMGLGIPAVNNLIVRSKTEGFARETSVLLQRTRLEAIKRNREGAVYLDTVNGGFAAFLDADLDSVFDTDGGPASDYEIGRLPLPSGVLFVAPGGAADVASVDGFDLDEDAKSVVQAHGAELPAVIYRPDGSVQALGAFRVGDERGNYLEIRVAPEATGRVEILKYQEPQDGTPGFYPAGDVSDPNYKPWEWK